MKTALLAYGATALVLAATSGWAVETKSKPAAKPTVYPIVRFISAGAPDRDGRLDQLTPMDLADLYTSLKITPSKSMAGPRIVDDSLICEPDNKTTPGKADCEPERAYSKERPSWLFRLFGTRTINIAAVANVQISDPDLPISAPLFSIQHQTLHNAPDEFVSNYTSSHSATPLFRIGASSVFTLHVHEAISNNQTFTGVSSLIQAVETATTIAAPHATLLTTLSSQDVSNASQAIDTAISGILSFQQTEDIELAHDISLTFADLSGRPTVYTIAARVPSNDVKFSYELTAGKSESVATDYDNKAEPAPTIGYWYVWLTCPRPSIFSAEDICNSLPATAEPDGSSPAYGKASNAVGSAGTSDDASPGLNSPTPGKPATPTGSGGTVGNGSEDALRVLPLSTPANSGAPRASAGNSVGASAQAPQPPARTENTPTPSSAQRWDTTNNAYTQSLDKVIVAVQSAVVARLAGRPSQVLSTKLSSQVTVEDFVTASDPYKSFFANPSRQPADTRKFCADVIDLLYKQGLSHFDARVVIWAMTRGMSDIIRLDAPAAPPQGKATVDIPSNCYDLVNPDPTGPNIPLNTTWGAKNATPSSQPPGH